MYSTSNEIVHNHTCNSAQYVKQKALSAHQALHRMRPMAATQSSREASDTCAYLSVLSNNMGRNTMLNLPCVLHKPS